MRYVKMLILGRSGSGKTSSMRNLDPVKTGIINCDKQELPFVKDGYETILNENGKPDLVVSNYVETGKPRSVIATLKAWEQRDDLDTIVIDTITHLMTSFYITDALGKDYGGYKELATSFWNIMDAIRDLRKNVIVYGHIKEEFNEYGDKFFGMRTHGKMIKEMEPESFFNILMLSEVTSIEGEISWIFRTFPENPAEKVKTPSKFGEDGKVIKAFEKYEDNDVAAIFAKLNKFYNN